MDAIKLDRQDWLRISIVFVVALFLRVWIVANTEVCARDTIGFIRFARMLDEQPWTDVVRSMHQMPGYPLALSLMSKPVLALHRGPSSEAYVLSAQIVSVLASLLTIPALYFAGRTFGSKNGGFFAALMFQMLPGWLQVTSDGLSEGLFFLFVAWSFTFAVLGCAAPRAYFFALAGIFSGMAYLTRPEGAELMPVIGLVTLIFGLMKWGLRTTATRLALVAVGAVPFVGAYIAITGGLTNKPASRLMLHGTEAASTDRSGPTLLPLAVFVDSQAQGEHARWVHGAMMLGSETAKSLRYVGALLALAGLIVGFRTVRREPAFWLTVALAVLHALVLWRMAMVVGYLSERHTLLLVLPALIWAALALDRSANYLTSIAPRWRFAPVAVVVGIGLSGAGTLARPLHFNRAGHHAAGRWLAANAQAQDELVDPFAWAHYYGGFFFREGTAQPAGPKSQFIVVEQGSLHPRLPLIPIASQLAQQGKAVYQWPEQAETAKIVVYEVKR